MSVTFDDEIRIVEQRIARRRETLVELANECEERARDKAASPAVLGAAVAAGFLLGNAMQGTRGGRPESGVGVGSLLVGAAWSLLRMRYGSIARLAQLILNVARTPAPGSRLSRGPAPSVATGAR
jgi:hypothetical protein